MTKYAVYLEETISTVRYTEADNEDEAIDKVLNEGVTGVMFLDHSYPDEGEWDSSDVEVVSDDEYADRADWRNTVE